MTEAITQREREGRYASTAGIDYASVPFKLWEKSKKLFWDPAALDFSRDAADWAGMDDALRLGIAAGARGFMVGEEAVTLDILPLLRAMSDEGRLEETMYLSMFAMEEAKHIEFFRRWFDAVGFDPRQIDADAGGYGGAPAPDGDPFGGLSRVMRRLDEDRSPQRVLDASLLYNQFIEAVLAIAGYKRFDQLFRAAEGKLPGLREGIRNVRRDERRHIAYGTYLCRRILAEHPELWEWLEERWARITRNVVADPLLAALARRRLDVLAVSRGMRPEDLAHASVEEFEPTDLDEAV